MSKSDLNMSDLKNLEAEILGAVEAAGDEAALEAVRVASLGKKGSLSEKMKTLGSMSPILLTDSSSEAERVLRICQQRLAMPNR